MTRICARPGCGRELPATTRIGTLYCSDKCCYAAFRTRHRDEIRKRNRVAYALEHDMQPGEVRKRGGHHDAEEVRYALYLAALLRQIAQEEKHGN